MRHLTRLVAAITVGLLAAGLLAVTSTSAQAAGRSWETVAKKAGGKAQACRVIHSDGTYGIRFRQNGKNAKRRTRAGLVANANGIPVHYGTTRWTRPGRVSPTKFGGTFYDSTNFRLRFSVKVKGGGRSTDRIRAKRITLC